MTELKVGMVLWEMHGYERNGICKWYAKPECIEYVDDNKVLFGDGSGGSISNLGKIWFLSRQEALDNHLNKHKSLEEKITDFIKFVEKDITHLERTDFQDLEVVRDDTINTTAVYLGFLDNLVNVTDNLKWHEEYVAPLYMEVGTLTLTEIYEQCKKMDDYFSIITVFTYSALNGTIYQCGNYEEGKWVKYGTTVGYA